MRTSRVLITALSAAGALLALSAWSGAGVRREQARLARVPSAGIQSDRQPASQNALAGNVIVSRAPAAFGRPMGTRSFMRPDAVGKPLIFISDGYMTVNIYSQDRTPKIVGWITGLHEPGDLATDDAGNLYVLTGAISPPTSVLVYAPPYTKPPKLTLEESGYSFGVAVSLHGLLAVTSCIVSSGSNCDSAVAFYPKNSATACRTIHVDPKIYSYVGYAAFDDKERLYIDGASPANLALIARIDGGCNAKGANQLSTANTIGSPGAIRLDKADRIAILDWSPASVIDTYDAPKKGSLGSPVSTTSLGGQSEPFFAFLASGRRLWAGVNPGFNGDAEEFSYPAGGAVLRTIPGGGFFAGVAVTPRLTP